MTALPPGDAQYHQNQRLAGLLERVARRDHRAFKELYKLTCQHLYGVALRILGNRVRAEEVLQEAYMNVWDQARTYTGRLGRPTTWLVSVVRNKCFDLLRAERIERENTAIEQREAAADCGAGDALQSGDPQLLLMQAALYARMMACFERLDAPQRQSLALAFGRGFSHAELSAHLRVPLGTAKAWVRRGLSQLKKCLDGDCIQA